MRNLEPAAAHALPGPVVIRRSDPILFRAWAACHDAEHLRTRARELVAQSRDACRRARAIRDAFTEVTESGG